MALTHLSTQGVIASEIINLMLRCEHEAATEGNTAVYHMRHGAHTADPYFAYTHAREAYRYARQAMLLADAIKYKGYTR